VRLPHPVLNEANQDWKDLGRCAEVDGDIFFPAKGESNLEAKLVCRMCEVRARCLDYALDNDETFGIWGGMSERQRRKVRRMAA
jgi:WhiB family transcriptional regulator, redox-sensing transcriptional regulator